MLVVFFMPVFSDRQYSAPAAVPADRRVDQGKTTADSSPVSCWLRTPPYPSVPQIVERSEPLTADRRVDQGNRPYRPHKPYGYWIVGAWSKTTADSSPVSCWLRTSPYSSVSLRTADCRAERAADRRLSPELSVNVRKSPFMSVPQIVFPRDFCVTASNVP